MSLLDRVNRASATSPAAFTEEDLFLELRKRVNSQLSDGTLSSLEEGGAVRAENEIRSACARIFAEEPWLSVSPETKERLTARFLDAVFGFGPLSTLLEDESVTEIMVNGPAEIYFERAGVLHKSSEHFANAEQVHALIDRIVGPLGRRVDESSPMVNARLPQGHRVNVVLEALALNGPVITIRKFSDRIITLDDMVRSGSLDQSLVPFLIWCIRGSKNVAVSGGTGSGKTTFLNALSCFIPHEERIVIIEDSAELRFSKDAHVVRLEARPQNAEGLGEVTIRDLVVNALRMRPDRIVVGECRGAEAFDMLQAMNTGLINKSHFVHILALKLNSHVIVI